MKHQAELNYLAAPAGAKQRRRPRLPRPKKVETLLSKAIGEFINGDGLNAGSKSPPGHGLLHGAP